MPFDEGIALDADGEYVNGEFGFDMNDLHFDFCTARGARRFWSSHLKVIFSKSKNKETK